MTEHLAETNNTEPVPEEVVFRYLDGVGNHEAKNLLATVVLADPQRDFTGATARYELNARQGNHPVWPVVPSGAKQYFERSLEPIGAVVKTRIPSRGSFVDAWHASEEYRDTRLALAGFISDWSLRWPEISVQQVFGSTSSRSEIRSPEIRSQMYWGLLTGSEGITFGDLAASLYHSNYPVEASLHNQIRAMRDLGILAVATKHTKYNPLLEIERTDYFHKAIEFDNTLPETRALYNAIQGQEPGGRFTVNELVTLAQKLDPSINTVKLRQRIINGTRDRRAFPGLKMIENGYKTTSAESVVSLTPSVVEPISELMEGLEAIRSGKNVAENIDKARAIIATPADFAALMTKARDNSPGYASKSAEHTLDTQLLSVIQKLGGATVKAARGQMIDQYDRQLDAGTISSRLRGLVRAGKLTVEKTAMESHSVRVRNHYILAPK